MIDRREPIILSESVVGQFINELNTLRYLASGLNFLYRQTKIYEDEVTRRVGKKRVWFFGADPLVEDMPVDLIACFFHWYSVTLCNYVWLVGWIGQESKLVSFNPDTYALRTIPNVLNWRNKVAAHFAKVKPKKQEDTKADREASVIFPIGFSDGAFEAKPFDVILDETNTPGVSSHIKSWQLTKVHEELVDRYPQSLQIVGLDGHIYQ